MRSTLNDLPRWAATTGLVVLLVVAVTGCSTGWAGLSEDEPPPKRADFAVVTIIDEEYRAMLRWLDEPRELAFGPDRWTVGELRGRYGERGAPRVLVIGAGEQGEVSGALTTQSVIDRWQVPYLLLVGIAGGIQGSVALGDVVVATVIWDYDIGHLGTAFEPGSARMEPDAGLLRASRQVPADWTRSLRVTPPREGVVPRVIEAEVASGDKVIETTRSEFFAAIDRASPGFAAVEMEGAGAAAAVERAETSGESVGFLMIRGVSDLVETAPHTAPEAGGVTRNPQRARWREFAADAATSFAAELIRQQWASPEPGSP